MFTTDLFIDSFDNTRKSKSLNKNISCDEEICFQEERREKANSVEFQELRQLDILPVVMTTDFPL